MRSVQWVCGDKAAMSLINKMKAFIKNKWKEMGGVCSGLLILVGAVANICSAKADNESMQNEREHNNWERQQEENSHKPRLQMDRKRELPLGTEYYRQYVLHNEGEALRSGEMYLTAQLVLKYKGYVIKNIVIDNCFYEQTVRYQADGNVIYILLWKPDVLMEVEQAIGQEIETKTGKMILARDIDMELCALAYFEYITAQNNREEEQFLIKFGDYSSCERHIDDAYLYHDVYHISVEGVETLTKEKGFQELMEDTVERLTDLEK